MPLAWHDHKIKTFAGLDQCIGNADRISGMHVVIDIAGDQHQMTLEVFGQILIFVDLGFEFR